MKKNLTLFGFLFLISSSFAQHASFTSKLIYRILPGITDSVYEGYYEVYENRNTNKGKKIKIYIVVIPSVNKTTAPPIFCTEGGPGVAVSKGLSFYADRNNIYRQNNDVVLIDARGTGKSNPLHCNSLQQTENIEEQFDDMYPAAAVKKCYRQLSKENDLTQYNTTNVVKDLNEIREWLGYKTIHLYGLSYGTRVVLQYMRMYPASVASSVLWSPTTTYERMPLHHAKYAQQAIELIWKDCMNDSACKTAFPDIKKEFIELMKRWKAKPFNYLWKDSLGNTKEIAVGWDAFQTKIRSLMYAPMSIRIIPYIVHEVWKGNLEPFIDLYPKGKNYNDFLAEGFYLCVTCTEDVPFIKSSEIKNETRNTFMGTYRLDQQQQACANWTRGVLPKGFLLPVKSSIPTLLLSGSLDPVTPTTLAKEIARHLSNSKLVIVPNMSHIFDGLSNENCFDELVMGFISNPGDKNLKKTCIENMLPPKYKVK